MHPFGVKPQRGNCTFKGCLISLNDRPKKNNYHLCIYSICVLTYRRGQLVDKRWTNQMGYTKLFNEIVMSTIWREPNHVRLLWITMLALKDQYHTVNASLPGLADAARISIDECLEALDILKNPDPFSRSKEFGGRRIDECDGGFLILNGEKYRKKLSTEERREYKTQKQREYRAKVDVDMCGQKRTVLTHKDKEEDTKEKENKDLSLKHLVTQARPNPVEVDAIFTYWQNTLDHPRSKLDEKRKSLIKKWLKVGYSVNDLCSAIAGCSKTPHNMGDNDNGQKYDSLELIFRTSDQIDRFMGNDLNPPQPKNQAQQRQSGNINAANKAMEII